MQKTAVEIRSLSTHEEFSEVVRLQRAVWGFQELELLPVRMFVVASKIGGQVLGAFDGARMAGFCLCIPGLKQGARPYLHSHMMGVLPEYRNTGLGRQMKWKQREFAVAEGIDLIEWTFDPLEIKNAYFNIERLGAVVRRQVWNQYGTSSSHLHGGLPTDRLIAEWWLKSDPQKRLPVASVAVPADIEEIRKDDRPRAREIQAEVMRQFEEHFSRGLTVVGFERGETHGTYLLAEWEFA